MILKILKASVYSYIVYINLVLVLKELLENSINNGSDFDDDQYYCLNYSYLYAEFAEVILYLFEHVTFAIATNYIYHILTMLMVKLLF